MALGALKQENVYKDIDCRTEEISVDLLVWDINFAFHP